MCFRPGDVDMSKACPSCGKLLHATSGVFPRVCPFCETSLEGLVDASELGMTSGASAPKPPVAPKIPSAPKPPVAPKVPSASKLPTE